MAAPTLRAPRAMRRAARAMCRAPLLQNSSLRAPGGRVAIHAGHRSRCPRMDCRVGLRPPRKVNRGDADDGGMGKTRGDAGDRGMGKTEKKTPTAGHRLQRSAVASNPSLRAPAGRVAIHAGHRSRCRRMDCRVGLRPPRKDDRGDADDGGMGKTRGDAGDRGMGKTEKKTPTAGHRLQRSAVASNPSLRAPAGRVAIHAGHRSRCRRMDCRVGLRPPRKDDRGDADDGGMGKTRGDAADWGRCERPQCSEP